METDLGAGGAGGKTTAEAGRKICALSCCIQPMVDTEKTGVGWATYELTRRLASMPEMEITFEAFAPTKEKQAVVQNVCAGLEGKQKLCKWCFSWVYQSAWPFIPIPYSLFFGREGKLHLFFNYHVPPGVPGKRLTMLHDMAVKAFPETLSRRTKLMLSLTLERSCRRAHHILTVSEFSKREIMKYMGIPEERITVIPNGVNTERFHPHLDLKEVEAAKKRYSINASYFLYLGTLEPRKNIERLIDAYAILCAQTPDAPLLVLAGRKGWLYEGIFKKVQEYGIEERVIFTGYVEDKDAPLLIKGARAFVFPSLYEGFGLPPLEAMACGTPVIVSNAASLPEVVGDAGIQVDPYSTEDLAAAMKRIAADEALRTELSEKGLKQAEKFTWDGAAQIVAELCHRLTDE